MILIILIILPNTAMAATIHGTVYDFYLEKQKNAVITINTTPQQIFVAKDAEYSFEVPAGNYEIIAEYKEDTITKSSTTESISIKEQGDYVVDMILFPFIKEPEIHNIIVDDYKKSLNYFDIIILFLGIAVLIFIISLILKYKRIPQGIINEIEQRITKEVEQKVKEQKTIKTDELTGRILNFIKKQDGRTTQKQIRKQFLFSEAKISLVISELEDKGIIKKIKKGRGNIIVLK